VIAIGEVDGSCRFVGVGNFSVFKFLIFLGCGGAASAKEVEKLLQSVRLLFLTVVRTAVGIIADVGLGRRGAIT
jgi:hypothetical protein